MNFFEARRLVPDQATLTLVKEIEPQITNKPALPAIDYSLVGQQAPVVQPPLNTLPRADVIIITWADAEWAALEHVFCQGDTSMPYSARLKGNWDGWVKDTQNLPSQTDATWDHWGSYRQVEVATRSVLLYKSNTHLDWPGQSLLEAFAEHLISTVQPGLILSIGTAGGARVNDAIGTVVVTRASTLYKKNNGASTTYTSSWQALDPILDQTTFAELLFPIPTTEADLQTLQQQFNAAKGTHYSLAELNVDNLDLGAPVPAISDLTRKDISLLTTPSFVVGTTDGAFASYACIEMDDAVLEKICTSNGNSVNFGSIRNISDPVQNAALSASVQGGWGSLLYKTYGFYTSYNGALAAWALVCAS